MANPFAPLLGVLGVSAVGRRPKKRRRKQKQSKGNGASTQRTSNRALDTLRIQHGLPRNGQEPSPQTASEVAESPTGNVPEGVPPLRISKVIGTDTIGMTTDGKRGYVGPQWWSRQGRNLLSQVRRRHPGATPEESLLLLLKQAVPSVEWESQDLPRGAHMLSRRLRRLVEAAYMGREAEARPPDAEEATGQSERSPLSPAEAPAGMPFAPLPEDLEGPVTPPVPSGIETSPESAAVATEACDPGETEAPVVTDSEPAQAPQGAPKTRRGGRGRGRRGGKRDRKAAQAEAEATVVQQAEGDAAVSASQESAHDTPEGDGGSASESDGGSPGDGDDGGDGGNSQDSRSDVPEASADAPSSE